MKNTVNKAVIVLSGGIDSTTLAYDLKDKGYELYGITFDYGQRQKHEIECAKATGRRLGFKEHLFIRSELDKIGGSYLTDQTLPVPSESEEMIDLSFVVPARNLMFLAFASSFAEVKGIPEIYIGFHADDFNDYPDCRELFRKAVENVVNLQKKDKNPLIFKILCPYMFLPKAEIIRSAIRLNVYFKETTSCYRSTEEPCGECHSCQETLKACLEAGLLPERIGLGHAVLH